MTDALSPLSRDAMRQELLSVVKSVKGQVLNAQNLYVAVDWKNPQRHPRNDGSPCKAGPANF